MSPKAPECVTVDALAAFLRMPNTCSKRVVEDQLIGADWVEDHPDDPRTQKCLGILERYITADNYCRRSLHYHNVLRARSDFSSELARLIGTGSGQPFISVSSLPKSVASALRDTAENLEHIQIQFIKMYAPTRMLFEQYIASWLTQVIDGRVLSHLREGFENSIDWERRDMLGRLMVHQCPYFLKTKSGTVRNQLSRWLKYGSNKVPSWAKQEHRGQWENHDES